MMGVGWLAATEEARLLDNVAKVMPCYNGGAGTASVLLSTGNRLISTGIARAF